jgi:hypothetical protein
MERAKQKIQKLYLYNYNALIDIIVYFEQGTFFRCDIGLGSVERSINQYSDPIIMKCKEYTVHYSYLVYLAHYS